MTEDLYPLVVLDRAILWLNQEACRDFPREDPANELLYMNIETLAKEIKAQCSDEGSRAFRDLKECFRRGYSVELGTALFLKMVVVPGLKEAEYRDLH